ncbi:response regulator transcription factor [Cohnella zeiphila]|uniref:Helix-turn-helix domain-containing protein n=1 Tax=Cohnella zeiphila TaxID=2761120 RepID=A0A7X0VY14_9BACL|nr:helix-turn-helix domain-containing protein [Cohnella zeiphila]MBB6732473.1 helix-turn-helix domain-containing protein [Cohnella zeiphila]
MKLMIVDDEVIIRTGLATVIDWREMGISLLPPAGSAEEALARLPEERPDILLTDIRMTGKTGLELAEEAARMLPRLEVVILSGYDDFIYTQQAIRQNVSDYLLKSSRPEEIIKTMLKVKKKAEERRVTLTGEERRRREESMRRFRRWVEEGIPDAGERVELPGDRALPFGEEAGLGGAWTVALIAAGGWGASVKEASLLLFAVDNALKDTLPCVSFAQDGRIAAALRSDAGSPCAEAYRAAFAKIERVLKCKLTVVFGTEAKHPRELHASYAAADEAFGFKPLMKPAVWSFDDVRHRQGGQSVCTAEEEKELSSLLLENDPMRLKAWAQTYARALAEDAEATPATFEAALQSVVIAAHRWLDRALAATGRDSAQEARPAMPAGKLGTAPGELLFQHLYGIMELYHGKLAGGQASHVRRALAYIEEMLGEDVRLRQIASRVHLHPSHLSDLFKKETGMRFVDYVTKKKMERAADILLSSPAKISEVAGMVGFGDVKYFGQMFKKYAGKTPSEYRERGLAP